VRLTQARIDVKLDESVENKNSTDWLGYKMTEYEEKCFFLLITKTNPI